MESKRHQGKSLLYVAVQPDNYSSEVDYPLVIMLHGFGANMNDLAGLCPTIGREGYLYACPNGPRAVPTGMGMRGFGWSARGGGTVEEGERVVGMLETFLEEVTEQYHVPPGQVILMGFSQGGGMTYHWGLVKPETFAGLGALSSVIPNTGRLKDHLPAQRTQSIFIAHGTQDEVVPVDRAREARDFLEGEGYSPQYKEYPMGHSISQEVLDDLVPWVNAVLPPVEL